MKSWEKETKKKFTKILINHLKEKLDKSNPEDNLYNQLEYKRIVTLIEREKNNNFLKRFSKEIEDNIMTLKVSFKNKSKTIKILGNTKLKDLSFLIQEKFNLDSCHLYEFETSRFAFAQSPYFSSWVSKSNLDGAQEPKHAPDFSPRVLDIGKYKYGPKCDEWEEIFDYLDNYRLDYAINASNLNVRDHIKFLFDFGDNLKFDIEIIEIKTWSKNERI